jgi:flagella basal body P-ring formation protein FlgA
MKCSLPVPIYAANKGINLMMNIFFGHTRLRRTITTLALILLFFAASAAVVLGQDVVLDEPLHLRTQIESKDAYLRFGDVFTNAGDLAEEVLTRAPEPGRMMSLDPAWLSARAAKAKRKWRNPSSLKRVTVRRAGHRIGTGALRTLIKEELGIRNEGVRYEIALANRGQTLFVPLDAQGEAHVVSLDMTAQRGTFTARIQPYDNAGTTEVRGRLWKLIQVPALTRPYSPGEEIMPEDIQWVDMREANLRPGTILDPEDFSGRATRRALRPGKPVRATDIKRLAAVNRGEIITNTYQVPGIRLTAKARALGEAALGESLRVVNLQSSRTIDVVVTAPGRAQASISPTVGG